MESIYTELALYGSKNECARTDNVFSLISEVCDGTVSLNQSSSYNGSAVVRKELLIEQLLLLNQWLRLQLKKMLMNLLILLKQL